jgi:site-specific DNA-cytosine methylase
LFAGGGLLSQAAKSAGFDIVAAVEINTAYADIFQANHGGCMYNCSVEEVPWDELTRLAPIGLLEMGIPCEPFSHIRRLNRGGQVKRTQSLPREAHELGDMVYWALKAADVLNPHTVIIEEVPAFLASGVGYILRLALARMGYTVDAKIINSVEYGALTARTRAVIVATTFPEVRWPDEKLASHRLGEILDPIPDDNPHWFNPGSKPWVYQHWERQTAKGNSFQPPQLTAGATTCPTIKKRYFAGQGDNAVVRHRHLPDHHRWLTLPEVRRLMGLPDDYVLGDTLTHAGEVLGQGVQVDTFTRIIRAVTRQEVPS